VDDRFLHAGQQRIALQSENLSGPILAVGSDFGFPEKWLDNGVLSLLKASAAWM
jgi:hypothetical protein